jgi:hypothetical protein
LRAQLPVPQILDSIGEILGIDIASTGVQFVRPPSEIWEHRYVIDQDVFNPGGVATNHYFRLENTVNASGTGNLNNPPSEWEDISGGIHAPGLPNATGPTTYEIMAFLSVANAETVGNVFMPSFFSSNENITDLPGLLSNTRNEWSAHSYQFNHDAATTTEFWARLKSRTGFRSTEE